jgi:hypothetical protein
MEDLFISFTILGFFFIIFGFIALMRYLSYKETLALAEKGLVRPERARGNGKGALIWGILVTAIGVALCFGLWPLGFLISGRDGGFPLGLGPWMLAAFLPMFFGLGLILVYVLTREGKKPEDKAKAPDVVEPPKAE